MNGFKDQLRKFRKESNLTQKELGQRIGVSRQVIASYEDGRAEPSLEKLIAMCDFFQVTLDELILGKVLKQESKLKVLTVAIDAENAEEVIVVPEKAAAGYLSGFEDPVFVEKLPSVRLDLPEFRNDRTHRIFQISGDSMSPIQSGSYLVTEYVEQPERLAQYTPVVVVAKSEGIVFKRILDFNERTMTLSSDNLSYNVIEIPFDEIQEVWKVKAALSFQINRPSELHREISSLRDSIQSLRKELKRS